jgi:hypothetical protein
VDGETEAGVPFARRGKVALDSALFRGTSKDPASASLNLVATVPLARRTFFEAVVPASIAVPFGNPTIGAHHVARLSDGVWLVAGGATGLPVLTDREDDFVVRSIPRAYWDIHHYWSDLVSWQLRLGLEYHVASFGLRIELEPSLWLGAPAGVSGAFQHALELQIGHGIGAGLRIQGVALGPKADHSGEEDHYQLAFSPFFGVWRDAGFLRLGLMLPADAQLGPPFAKTWGLLCAAGLHVD